MARLRAGDAASQGHAIFSTGEWLGMLLGYLVVVLALFTLGYRLNEETQAHFFEERSQEVVTTMGIRVGEIRTLLTAVVGMHYVSNGFRNTTLAGFAMPLRTHAPYIAAIGRFERVSAAQRLSYEASMAEQGLYRFAIQHYDSNGIRRYDTLRAHYYPVAYVEPTAPDTLSLVGNNLGGIREFAGLMDQAAASASPFVSQLPEPWPLSGQLLLAQPVYRGQHVPLLPALRHQHADGGYWLAIDLDSIIDRQTKDAAHLDIELTVRNDGTSRTVYQTAGVSDDAAVLPDIHAPRTTLKRWSIGSSELLIKITGRLPIGKPFVLVALISFLALTLVFGLLIRARYRERRAEQARQRHRTALFDERERAERTLNALTDVVFSLDSKVCLLHMNPAAERWAGIANEMAVGKPLSHLLTFYTLPPEPSRFELAAALSSLDATAVLSQDVCLSLTEDPGSVVNLSLSRTLDPEGQPSGFIMVMRDVSVERELTRELEFQARHDPLTGCFNRYHFEACLARLIGETPQRTTSAALLYMDLDQFKVVNDTCGHTAGDRLLVELTANLTALVRDGDVLSRLGGDEFGLIILGCDVDATRQVAERVYAMFQKFVFTHGDQAFAVRASLGLVLIDEHERSVEEVLSAADIACYTAKDQGRNGLCIYSDDDASMTRRHQEMNWAPRLQDALLNDRFVLLVQAVASLDQKAAGHAGDIEHFEFLLRLKTVDDELISPFQFIQAAERYDLMQQIDRWVIDRAVRTVSDLPRDVRRHYTFSINISGQSAADPGLLGYMSDLFETSDAGPASFWIELTETAAISHFTTALTLIEGLRRLGIKVALDDFGSGLSSFGYLKSLPVDIIKIDGQFVREIADNVVDSEMVRAIDRVGKSMGIRTVAEFVETQAIVDELITIGVDYAQGYHIGRPCPLDEALSTRALKRAS